MKSCAYLFLAGLFLLSSCTHELEINEDPTESSRIRRWRIPRCSPPSLANQQKVRDQLVVKYVSGLPEITKSDIRKKYHVKEIKRCNCADESLELWTFNMDSIGSVEEIKGEATSDPDLEGTDFQYLFKKPASVSPQNSDYQSLINLIKPANQGVTIAIIDSGLDFDHTEFNSPILYNSQAAGDYCIENELIEVSGWDFVDEDQIAEDQHGHGTVVADIIDRTLANSQTSYQLLPVRAFDSNGKGTYFDILCGFRFASLKTDVKIINMSFGWYYQAFELLPQFVNEVEGSILIVSSSGNQGVNADIYNHFPSGYGFANLLSVGGMDSVESSLASFSNYGFSTVDITAPSQNILFQSGSTTQYFSGTSFATAYVTAEGVRQYIAGNEPADLITQIQLDAIFKNTLLFKTKYPKMVDP